MLYLAHFIGAALLVNAIPHLVKGVSGARFQSPFAKPPGIGLSSPTSNVLWGGLNFVVGFLLLARVGPFTTQDNLDLLCTLSGGWISAYLLARYFQKLYPPA